MWNPHSAIDWFKGTNCLRHVIMWITKIRSKMCIQEFRVFFCFLTTYVFLPCMWGKRLSVICCDEMLFKICVSLNNCFRQSRWYLYGLLLKDFSIGLEYLFTQMLFWWVFHGLSDSISLVANQICLGYSRFDVFKRDTDFTNVYVLAMILPWEGRVGLMFYVSMKVAMALNCLWFWLEDWRDYEVFVSWFLLELIFFRRLILLEFRRFVYFSYSEVFCSFAFSWRK